MTNFSCFTNFFIFYVLFKVFFRDFRDLELNHITTLLSQHLIEDTNIVLNFEHLNKVLKKLFPIAPNQSLSNFLHSSNFQIILGR